MLLAAAPSFAQEADAKEDAADSRATSFQAVEGPQKEQVAGGPLLVGAYAFVLVLLVGYVARLASLQSKTTAEVERLTRAIERAKQG
jgi:type VI protein secretion system component VasF